MSDSGDGFRFLFATITTDALLEAISRLPSSGKFYRNTPVVVLEHLPGDRACECVLHVVIDIHFHDAVIERLVDLLLRRT